MLRRSLLGALPLALAILGAAGAGAFATLPPGTSPHDDITKAGAERAGFPGDAVRALQQAVREPDFQESEYEPHVDDLARTDADGEYEASHHCDRVLPASHEDAFAHTVRYIREQRDAAGHASAAGKVDDAVAALGRALHAVQDCYSHTNIVDLGAQAQAAHQDALLEEGAMVDGLRLVSYDPGADEPGRPEGDDYGHDDFAKDSAEMNDEAKARLPDGRTKYEAAREMAGNATHAFLRAFLDGLPADQRADLMEAKPEDGGLPDDAPVPGMPVAAVLVAVAIAALPWRRR